MNRPVTGVIIFRPMARPGLPKEKVAHFLIGKSRKVTWSDSFHCFPPEADDCLKLLTGQLFGCFVWNVRENGPAARYGPHINGLFFQIENELLLPKLHVATGKASVR